MTVPLHVPMVKRKRKKSIAFYQHTVALFVLVAVLACTGRTEECTACPPGTFADSTAPACRACPAGACTDTAQCTPCPAGTYASGHGRAACEPCGPGRGDAQNHTACAPCAPGTAQPTDAGRCVACAPGTFANASAAAACAVCAPGSSAPAAGARACEPCAPGSFSPGRRAAAAAQCAPCPGGFYCAARGTAVPQPCPAMHRCPPGATRPAPCAALWVAEAEADACDPSPVLYALVLVALALGGATAAAATTLVCLCTRRPAGSSGGLLASPGGSGVLGGARYGPATRSSGGIGRGGVSPSVEDDALFGAAPEDEFRGLIPRPGGPVYNRV